MNNRVTKSGSRQWVEKNQEIQAENECSNEPEPKHQPQHIICTKRKMDRHISSAGKVVGLQRKWTTAARDGREIEKVGVGIEWQNMTNFTKTHSNMHTSRKWTNLTIQKLWKYVTCIDKIHQKCRCWCWCRNEIFLLSSVMWWWNEQIENSANPERQEHWKILWCTSNIRISSTHTFWLDGTETIDFQNQFIFWGWKFNCHISIGKTHTCIFIDTF